MKTLIALSLLFSMNAFSRVTEDMPINRLPKGTTLTAEKEIMISPGTEFISFQDGQLLKSLVQIDPEKPVCSIGLSESNNFRALRVGRVLQVDSIAVSGRTEVLARINLNNVPAFESFSCASKTRNISEGNWYAASMEVLSVADLKDVLGPYFTLRYEFEIEDI